MYKKILAPIDIQHRSSWTMALPKAVHEARNAEGAKLYVMTVVPDVFAGVDWRYALRGEKEAAEGFDKKKMTKQAEARLKEIVGQMVPDDLPSETVVRHGTPYAAIVEAAADLDADLIVLAAYRPSLKDYLLGPTAARVVRHADCSVLVVRSDDAEAPGD